MEEKIITLEDICELIEDRDIQGIYCNDGTSWERDEYLDDCDVCNDESFIEYYKQHKDDTVTHIEPEGYYDLYHRINIYTV